MTIAVRFGRAITPPAQRDAGLRKDAKQSDALAINAEPVSVKSDNGLACLLASSWYETVREGTRAQACASNNLGSENGGRSLTFWRPRSVYYRARKTTA